MSVLFLSLYWHSESSAEGKAERERASERANQLLVCVRERFFFRKNENKSSLLYSADESEPVTMGNERRVRERVLPWGLAASTVVPAGHDP